MYLYFFLFLFTLTKRNFTVYIKKKGDFLNSMHFLCPNVPRKLFPLIFLSKKESTRHEIYRKRFERKLKDAIQAILYKKGIKFNYKYHIDEDIIEGITVYKVELNSDCSVAKVYVEIMGDSIDSRQGFIWIKKNCKIIRYNLAQLMKDRKRVPFLNFVLSNLSEQTLLFCEMENIKEHYADMFKDDLEKAGIGTEENWQQYMEQNDDIK
ncbi:ribosome-binding factor A, putative [Plasmodium malariae]|uniref:Ribosome-binding factor A, putative n=1 Tax=Plasmodium malariae TaxID=5858 RepID=A0A1C3KY26_PLAMA|nr:ribosome-binding factor A, putative [Plasmodium malariae]